MHIENPKRLIIWNGRTAGASRTLSYNTKCLFGYFGAYYQYHKHILIKLMKVFGCCNLWSYEMPFKISTNKYLVFG
jgi:hypothetical protein